MTKGNLEQLLFLNKTDINQKTYCQFDPCKAFEMRPDPSAAAASANLADSKSGLAAL